MNEGLKLAFYSMSLVRVPGSERPQYVIGVVVPISHLQHALDATTDMTRRA